jgi:hypothetical protein
MKRFAVLVAKISVLGVFALGGCSPDPDTTGAISNCVRDLFPTYNPKIMDQCVNACKKCDHDHLHHVMHAKGGALGEGDHFRSQDALVNL